MSQSNPSPAFPTLVTFLIGAAVGAVVVALSTPRTGPRLRRDLKALARRGKARAHKAVEGFRGADTRSRRTFAWHVAVSKPEGA